MSDCVTFYIFLFSPYHTESVLFAGLSDFTSTRHAGRREMHCFLIEVRCRRELRRNVGWKRGGGASAAGHRHSHKFAIRVLMGNYCPDTDTDIRPEYAPLRSSRPSFFFLSSATPLIILCYRYGKFESCRRTYMCICSDFLFCFVATLVRNMRVRVARRVRGGDGGRCRIMNYTKLRLSLRNKVRTAASF